MLEKIAIFVHCRSQNLFLSIEKTEKTCNYRGWGSVEESQRKFIQGIVNKNQKFFFRLLTFSLTRNLHNFHQQQAGWNGAKKGSLHA